MSIPSYSAVQPAVCECACGGVRDSMYVCICICVCECHNVKSICTYLMDFKDTLFFFPVSSLSLCLTAVRNQGYDIIYVIRIVI